MRDFAKISPVLWGSHKFQELKSDQAKLLYLYFHTCPHANSIGCYRLPIGYIQEDLNWETKIIETSIKNLDEAKLVSYNTTEKIVYIRNFLAHSPITNKKHAIGAIKMANALPDCDESNAVINDLKTNKMCAGA